MRIRVGLGCLGLLAAVPAAGALAQDRPRAAAREAAGDVAAGLDMIRAGLALGADGRLRAELTFAQVWDAATLSGSGAGPPASVCLRLYTKRDPASDVADYLVCATPAPDGDGYVGRVLRERRNAPPRTIARIPATRPTSRTVYLRFGRSAVLDPGRIRFAGEVTVPGPECSASLGCRDRVPNGSKTVTLLLRSTPAAR